MAQSSELETIMFIFGVTVEKKALSKKGVLRTLLYKDNPHRTEFIVNIKWRRFMDRNVTEFKSGGGDAD